MPKITNRRPTTYIGIDPGKSGGLVALTVDENNRLRVPITSPMYETPKDIFNYLEDVSGFLLSLQEKPLVRAVIEKVSSSPQMGVVSAFTFGQGYGQLIMALTALDIPYEEIRPQVWQKALNIPTRKKTEKQPQFKERLRYKSQQLFPELYVWNRTLGEQRAICDALLIAEYCRRKYEGLL